MTPKTPKSLLPHFNSLWIGDELHPIHRLCLSSAVFQGHAVRLFSYGPLRNAPEGVELADAETVLPKSELFLHRKTGSPAPFADRFRIKLIGMGLGAWIDTDILFVRPLRSDSLNVFGWEDDKLVGNALLQMDPQSDLYRLVSRYINEDFMDPPWLPRFQRAMLQLRRTLGIRQHVGAMPYGTTGPDLLTWALRETHSLHLARPLNTFYPLPYSRKTEVFKRSSSWFRFADLPKDIVAVHLWFQGLAGGLKAKATHNAIPEVEPGSFLDDCARHMGVALA